MQKLTYHRVFGRTKYEIKIKGGRNLGEELSLELGEEEEKKRRRRGEEGEKKRRRREEEEEKKRIEDKKDQ